MNLVFTIVIGSVLAIGGIFLIFNMSGKVFDFEKELFEYDIQNFTSNEYYIITGDFKTARQCDFSLYNFDNTINKTFTTPLEINFNVRFNQTKKQNMTLNFTCCNIQNKCFNQIHIIPN